MSITDEDLQEFEVKLSRLKIEYEQYFLGVLKREPQFLRGEVQRMIQQTLNRPPTNPRQKFKFNTLVSRFQCYRQLWERTLRKIEEGSYERHLFKANLRDQERGVPNPRVAPDAANGGAAPAGIQKLYNAFASARGKTGEGMGDLSPSKLAAVVKKQTSELRRQHGKGKLKFKVVVEDGRARLKATFVPS
jgi:hypothetical protein